MKDTDLKQELEFRKFPKIKRLPEEEKEQHQLNELSLLDLIRDNQPFAITEKLDGANSGIEILKQKGEVEYRIFSHNSYLDPTVNDLRGWYQHAEEVVLPKLLSYLADQDDCHFYFYGEWLVPHTVKYTDDVWNHWYLFSVFDAVTLREWLMSWRQELAEKEEIRLPDVLFDSTKADVSKSFFDHYVGKSKHTLEADHGEGIVVECNGIRAKIRSQEFAEVKKHKKNKVIAADASQQFILDTLTPARVHKMLHKFEDEKKLPTVIDFQHFNAIANLLATALWNDIMTEEGNNKPAEVFWNEDEARKFLNRQIPQYVREYIKNYEEEHFDLQ